MTAEHEIRADFKGAVSDLKMISAMLDREDNLVNFQLGIAVSATAAAVADPGIDLQAFDLVALFNSRDMEFTKTPNNVAKMVDFLHSIGSVKSKPGSWKDLFFAEVHGLPGS